MHYPWWYVPFLTAPMLIALVSVFHVYVSMYAVGGGLFLALETQFAYRRGNRRYLGYLKDHAWFFILVTIVYGAITGVGIWWTIGLASPLATEMLIHIFVFGWAMEYVFFVLEIASAFIFYYYWGRLEPKTHQIIGWIYAFSAVAQGRLYVDLPGDLPGSVDDLHPGFRLAAILETLAEDDPAAPVVCRKLCKLPFAHVNIGLFTHKLQYDLDINYGLYRCDRLGFWCRQVYRSPDFPPGAPPPSLRYEPAAGLLLIRPAAGEVIHAWPVSEE